MINQDNSKIKLCYKDYFFAVISAIAGILFATLVLFGSFNLGFTIANLFLLVSGSIYLKINSKSAGAFGWILLILCGLGSIVFALTSDGFAKFILFLLLCFAEASLFRVLTAGKNALGDLKLPLVALYTVFVPTFDHIVGAVKLLFSGRKGKSGQYKKIFGGTLLALPVLLVVVPLLVNSDAAFEGLIKTIGGDFFLWILKIALGLLIAPFIYTYFFANRNFGKNYRISKKLKPVADSLWGVSFLGVISLCYILYLLSQLAYIFGGLSGILPENYTMAEYARRGFFENAIISVINFTLVHGSWLICKRTKLFSAFQIFVCAFTMFLIVTAEAKMIMYISRFGMTTLRLLTSAFLLFLFVLGIVFILRIICKKLPVIRPAMIAGLVLTILIGGIGTSRIVATYNTEAYINGKLSTVDVETISDCGDAAVEQLIKLEKHLKNGKDDDSYNKVMEELINKFYEIYAFEPSGELIPKEAFKIENYNLEASLSKKSFDKFIEQNPDFIQKAFWYASPQNEKGSYDNEDYINYNNWLEYGVVDPVTPPEFATVEN